MLEPFERPLIRLAETLAALRRRVRYPPQRARAARLDANERCSAQLDKQAVDL